MGCDPSPAEVVETAAEQLSSGQEGEALSQFDEKSREMLVGLANVADETSNRLKVPISAEDILGNGMVMREEINGQRAVVWVGTEKNSASIPFIRENGAWKIRGLDTEVFWEAP